jgi:hypothetical protein
MLCYAYLVNNQIFFFTMTELLVRRPIPKLKERLRSNVHDCVYSIYSQHSPVSAGRLCHPHLQTGLAVATEICFKAGGNETQAELLPTTK